MTEGYRQDYAAMGRFLAGPEMLKMVAAKGAKVLAAAEAAAPDHEPLGTGYVTAFELEVGVRPGKHPRACATVRNTSPHARFVEFGGKATPRHRTLGKALGAAG